MSGRYKRGPERAKARSLFVKFFGRCYTTADRFVRRQRASRACY
nr:MAG TPA: hypothetical protein [Caudoviricetes sp.]